jgi:hypothetical protein
MPHHSVVPQAQAIEEMLANTEDAYGFPPYRYLSQALSIGGLSYHELKERERLILVSAMESVQVSRLGSNDFSWADRIAASLTPGLGALDLLALDPAATTQLATATTTNATNGAGTSNGTGSGNETVGNEVVEMMHPRERSQTGSGPTTGEPLLDTGAVDTSSTPD